MGRFIILFSVLIVVGFIIFVATRKTLSSNQNEPLSTPQTSVSNSPSPTVALNTTATPAASPSSALIISQATITTSKGDIVLKFFQKEAPNTVLNFYNKAKSGFYNGLTFHRVEDWVIQGGDPKGDGTGGGSMPTELNDEPFGIGALGVARASDIKVSNDSQFFITKKDSQFLNKQYTNFGTVTAGMDVVNKIQIGDKILKIVVQ